MDLVKINFDGAVFVKKKIVNLIICLNILVRKKYCLNVLFTMNNLTKNIHKMHYLKHISVWLNLIWKILKRLHVLIGLDK